MEIEFSFRHYEFDLHKITNRKDKETLYRVVVYNLVKYAKEESCGRMR